MTFTKEQKREAYKRLAPEVQDLVMSNETTELIDNYLKEVGLSEEQSVLADTEILLAMYGLQTLSDAIDSVAKLGNKNVGSFHKLKINLETNIFDKIQNYKKTEGTEKEVENFTSTKLQDYAHGEELAKRIDEISKKYGLAGEQQNGLINISNSLFVNPEKNTVLLNEITEGLGVSQLLAEQIMGDMKIRVFDYIVKNRGKKNEEISKLTSQTINPNQNPEGKIEPDKQDVGPADKLIEMEEIEVRPETVPMVEKGEGVKIEPAPEMKPPVEPQEIPRADLGQAVAETIKPPEPPRAPVSAKVEEFFSKQPELVSSTQAVSNVTPPVTPPEPTPQPAPQMPTEPTVLPNPIPPPPKKYTVDPYREPLE